MEIFAGGFFVFFAIFFVFVVVLIIKGWGAGEKRTTALRLWAEGRGYRFHEGSSSHARHRFGHFGCFQRGRNRYAYNVTRAEIRQMDVWAFDYHYETTSTDSKGRTQTHHHYFSAVIFGTGMHLTQLDIRPEGFFDRIGGFFGFDDIDFESAEFSRKFHVKSPDRRWAYDVIHTGTMELLLGAPGWTLEMTGSDLLITGKGLLDPDEYDAAIRLGAEFIQQIPADIRKERALYA